MSIPLATTGNPGRSPSLLASLSYRFAKPDPISTDPIRDKGRETPPLPSICVVAYSTLPPFGRGLPFGLEKPCPAAVPAICVAPYASRGWRFDLASRLVGVAGEGHHVLILRFFLLTSLSPSKIHNLVWRGIEPVKMMVCAPLSRTGAYSACLGEIHVKRGDFPCVLLSSSAYFSRIAWNLEFVVIFIFIIFFLSFFFSFFFLPLSRSSTL